MLDKYRLRLVFPLTIEKELVVYDKPGLNILYRRKSPKRQSILDIVDQAVYIPGFLVHRNLEVEVLLIRVEEVRIQDGLGSWRRRGISIADRKLLEVVDRKLFEKPEDFLALLPEALPAEFTNKLISQLLGCPAGTAQKLTYTFRNMGLIRVVRKQGRAQVFERLTKPSKNAETEITGG